MSELVPFGEDRAWMAVRDRPQVGVVEALGLTGGRMGEVEEAVHASLEGVTAVLPPLPGVGGRWTLVVGQDVAHTSATRVRSLAAMLGTEVQTFAPPHGGARHCLRVDHHGLREEVDLEGGVAALAGEWSLDPTGLSGPAPGSAILVGALRAEPPPPPEVPDVPKFFWQRGPWLWRRGR